MYVCALSINNVVKEKSLNTHFSVLTYYMQCVADYSVCVHTFVETLELLRVKLLRYDSIRTCIYAYTCVCIEHTLI